MSERTNKRVLVVANETVEGDVLHEAIGATRAAEVHVIAPALNSRLRHWVSDEDDAQRAAGDRLAACLERLRKAGVDARGSVGDGDPLQALSDALRFFPADEIVIATHPEGRSHWLARNLVERARSRFAQPIVHVVVDLVNHREYVALSAAA
jgi:nucleotide-binding universal stress UspA family protein